MKILKKTLIILFLFTMILVTSTVIYYHYWRGSQTLNTFYDFSEPALIDYNPIYWKTGNIGDLEIEKTALFIQVKVNGLNQKFYMQLDTGTPETVFYGKIITQLTDKLPSLKPQHQMGSTYYLNKVLLHVGKTKLKAKQIRVLPSMGNAVLDTSFTVIGTLGFDVLVNRTLVLNFKKNKLAITSKDIDKINANAHLVKGASVSQFPILLPATINHRQVRLFYDSGSSMFSVLTSIRNLSKLKSDVTTDSLCCVNNWTRQLMVYRKTITSKIKIGTILANNKYVYGMDIMGKVDYLPDWFLYGITGNKLFDNKIIIIDNKNNQFGIIN